MIDTNMTVFGMDEWSATGIYKQEYSRFGQTWIELEIKGKRYSYNTANLLGYSEDSSPEKSKTDLPQEIIIRNAPQGCWTGRHTYHVYVPWQHNAAYDKHCVICNHEAAWTAGSGISLCDCCAQDWHDWNSEKKILSGAKGSWGVAFALFQQEQIKIRENK